MHLLASAAKCSFLYCIKKGLFCNTISKNSNTTASFVNFIALLSRSWHNQIPGKEYMMFSLWLWSGLWNCQRVLVCRVDNVNKVHSSIPNLKQKTWWHNQSCSCLQHWIKQQFCEHEQQKSQNWLDIWKLYSAPVNIHVTLIHRLLILTLQFFQAWHTRAYICNCLNKVL